MTDFIFDKNHIDTAISQLLANGDATTAALVSTLREQGTEIGLAIVNAETNEVFVDTRPDGACERAHGQLREQITGIPYRDPAEVDLLCPAATLRDPILMAAHVAKVRSMLLYVTDFYRPDLMNHPVLNTAADHAISTLAQYQGHYAALPDAYARWDQFAGTFFEWPEELPRQRKGKVRHWRARDRRPFCPLWSTPAKYYEAMRTGAVPGRSGLSAITIVSSFRRRRIVGPAPVCMACQTASDVRSAASISTSSRWWMYRLVTVWPA